MPTTEVVLPSGEFAAIRTILVSDMVAFSSLSGLAAMAILAQRCATIDGKTLSPEEFLALPYGNAQPIFEALNAQLRAAYATRNGVA